MTNDNVFDYKNDPVYVQMTNTVQTPDISAPPETSAGSAGSLFSLTGSASALVVLGLTSATFSLLLSNPSNSGKTVYISRLTGSIGGSSLLSSLFGSTTLFKGGTLSGAASQTPTNNNFNSTTASVVTAQSSTSGVTGGTTVYSYQLAPGPFVQNFIGGIVVPPGSSLSATVTSSSSVAGLTITSVINLAWWEA
ncbi:hypothetical protein AV654_01455 [Paenibacillus elgii]|uniref:Uncharacterized protein n=1 Tax=Paenibacillus elgii TaxID=189691 RepID=A0A161S7Q5_9BACL|nr:hypothetical protein [Paenibacillus elgii]KZE81189.1 hypothetical protein AV654_01455 [Paenibacillus elgii]